MTHFYNNGSLGILPDEKLVEITETAQKGLSFFFEAGITKWSKYQFSVFFLYKVNTSRIVDKNYYELEFDDPRIEDTVRSWENEGYLKVIGSEDLYAEMIKPFGIYKTEASEEEVTDVLRIAVSGLNRSIDDGSGKWSRFFFVALFIGSASDYKVSFSEPRIQNTIRYWVDNGFINHIGEDDLYIQVLKRIPLDSYL